MQVAKQHIQLRTSQCSDCQLYYISVQHTMTSSSRNTNEVLYICQVIRCGRIYYSCVIHRMRPREQQRTGRNRSGLVHPITYKHPFKKAPRFRSRSFAKISNRKNQTPRSIAMAFSQNIITCKCISFVEQALEFAVHFLNITRRRIASAIFISG